MFRIENNHVISGPGLASITLPRTPLTLAQRARRVFPFQWLALGFALGVLYASVAAGATSRWTFWALLAITALLVLNITARLFPLQPGSRR